MVTAGCLSGKREGGRHTSWFVGVGPTRPWLFLLLSCPCPRSLASFTTFFRAHHVHTYRIDTFMRWKWMIRGARPGFVYTRKPDMPPSLLSFPKTLSCLCSPGGGGRQDSGTTSTRSQADGLLGELVDGEWLPYFGVDRAAYQVQGVDVYGADMRVFDAPHEALADATAVAFPSRHEEKFILYDELYGPAGSPPVRLLEGSSWWRVVLPAYFDIFAPPGRRGMMQKPEGRCACLPLGAQKFERCDAFSLAPHARKNQTAPPATHQHIG